MLNLPMAPPKPLWSKRLHVIVLQIMIVHAEPFSRSLPSGLRFGGRCWIKVVLRPSLTMRPCLSPLEPEVSADNVSKDSRRVLPRCHDCQLEHVPPLVAIVHNGCRLVPLSLVTCTPKPVCPRIVRPCLAETDPADHARCPRSLENLNVCSPQKTNRDLGIMNVVCENATAQ
jgi:hypothetical protein